MKARMTRRLTRSGPMHASSLATAAPTNPTIGSSWRLPANGKGASVCPLGVQGLDTVMAAVSRSGSLLTHQIGSVTIGASYLQQWGITGIGLCRTSSRPTRTS